MGKDDIVSRVLGVVVFVAGIALLGVVFALAYHYFTANGGSLPTTYPPDTTAPASTKLGESAVRMLARIGVLIVMTLVASLLASKGIHLYFAATGRDPERQGRRE